MNLTSKPIPNYIHQLQLENFTCFAKADMEFSKGINVFIGENGTGKTHVLKLLYALEEVSMRLNGSKDTYGFDIGGSVTSILGTKKIGDLVRSRKQEKMARVKANLTQFQVGFEMLTENYEIKNVAVSSHGEFPPMKKKCLYIPPQQVLSFFEGFTYAYENRESALDYTYYKLAKRLGLLPLKGEKLEEAQRLLMPLREKINIDVYQKHGKFFIRYENYDLEASLEADGVNKIGQLIYLILNGSLNRNTILFWDEPEVSLNPQWIRIIADFLQVLALEGVQIFVATHDYLLSHHLSLMAEYRKDLNEEAGKVIVPEMQFFGFAKGELGTKVSSGSELSMVTKNAILDEYAEHDILDEQMLSKYFKP